MQVTKERIFSDFNKLKTLCKKNLEKEEYEEAIECLKIAARLMYNFNLIYTDDDLEKTILNISKKFFQNISNKENERENNTVVFYDYFSLDNRGLTEQYIEALINLNYKIIYITQQNNLNKMENILKLLKKSRNVEYYIINSKLKNLEKSKKIREIILEKKPKYLFNHTAPCDIVGMIALVGIPAEKYLINLTDHAFWLGKVCTDYYIEFRSYGKNISKYYRKISNDREFILPYYPITNKEIKFYGFPFETINKKLIFSGGSLYKIYGSSKFFELVKYILEIDKDTIFLYLGNGNDEILKKFVLDNSFEKRFYFFNERKDINEIFKRCYFYLGTYPMGGALMSQLAIINKKIPVCYYDKDIDLNNINELFINNKENFMFDNLEEIKLEIKKLLYDQKYKEQKERNIENIVISKEKFMKGLQSILKNKKSIKYREVKYKPDIDKVALIYLEQENKYLKQYYRLFLSKNFKINLYFYQYFFMFSLNFIFKKLVNFKYKIFKI